jgi:tRNA dimethylallyltransferase
MSHLITIIGPTAVGKSQLVMKLAQALDGEIVNADSRQVYRFMDIGTAKPRPEELSLIPHHLINIADPDEDFGLAQYLKLSAAAISEIQRRDKLALLVGGSGQYVWSVVEGWEIPRVPPDLEFRKRLEEQAAKEEGNGLYQELVKVDPTAAKNIGPHNIRRVIRALEVYQSTGVPFSQLKRREKPPFKTLIIGLTADREKLYRRIDLRVDKMIERGLVAEVEKLLRLGYSLSLPAMSGIGYKQIGLFLSGSLTLDEAIQQIKFATHRFARHQYTWFRLSDSRIRWFDITSDNMSSESMDLITHFVRT